MNFELSPASITLVVVPLFGVLISNITLYLRTRSDNALTLRTLEETRKADREDQAQKRAWDIEDRARVAADWKVTTASIHAAIIACGTKADAAFSEANNSNVKIAALQQLQLQANEILAGQYAAVGKIAGTQLSRIELTAEKTNVAITEHDAWVRGRTEGKESQEPASPKAAKT